MTLERRTPLKRTRFVRRRSARQVAFAAELDAVRPVIAARSKGICERCSSNPATEIHHRKPRSTREPNLNDPGNLAHLCDLCHRWAESKRTDAYKAGWLVRRNVDPLLIAPQPIHRVTRGL